MGRAERIRVPFPAASTTTSTGWAINPWDYSRAQAFPQNHSQVVTRAGLGLY